MLVCDNAQGRYGNAIFRYLASSLFCILYNAKRTYNTCECNITISDSDFINWSNSVLSGHIPDIDLSKNYLFRGYYQHDRIFLKYKSQLIQHIFDNPNDNLVTDGNIADRYGNYHYNVEIYKSCNLIVPNNTDKSYDIVVHLRLEDFVSVNQVIHPKCIYEVLQNFKHLDICFVFNKPTTPFEHKYIHFFTSQFNIVCESNDAITDFHIMKNAKTLICSRSTLSWAASFFSQTLETLYFPNYDYPDRLHETFKYPITNTILYDIYHASEYDISMFLDSI